MISSFLFAGLMAWAFAANPQDGAAGARPSYYEDALGERWNGPATVAELRHDLLQKDPCFGRTSFPPGGYTEICGYLYDQSRSRLSADSVRKAVERVFVQPLLEVLKNPQPLLRRRAFLTLALIEFETRHDLLEASAKVFAQKDPDPALRREALAYLIWKKEQVPLDRLKARGNSRPTRDSLPSPNCDTWLSGNDF